MTRVCFYFQLHQPARLRKLYYQAQGLRQIPSGRLLDFYLDGEANRRIFRKVASKCYLPATRMLLDLIDRYRFKVSFSFSGVFIEQALAYCEEVVDLLRDLQRTGCVEFLDETYYHSLACFISTGEFKGQVEMHRQLMADLLNTRAKVFRNTELIYSNEIARIVKEMGYQGVLTEGVDRILRGRSPNHIYLPRGLGGPKVLLRNYQLSDDIAFRFSARGWSEHPLTADKFARWLSATPGDCINLFMDYETFGEHQWKDTGIFDFLYHLPGEILGHPNLEFATPSELLELEPVGELDVPEPISWADRERDASAWLGNDLQHLCFQEIKKLEKHIPPKGEFRKMWRYLQQSDPFYYMSTKGWDSSGHIPDGDVHNYFSHYHNPYYAAFSFLYTIASFKLQLSHHLSLLEPEGERRRKAKIGILLAATIDGRLLQGEIAPEKLVQELKEEGYLTENGSLTPKGKTALKALAPQPQERAFHFYQKNNYTGETAHNLLEFREIIRDIPRESIEYHQRREDFANWIKNVIKDPELAAQISKAETREELLEVLEKREKELLAGL